VVSHAQGQLVQDLLEDLKGCNAVPFKVVLTLNVPEQLPFDAAALPFPVRVMRNAAPRGFGANHNAAFAACEERFFCVLNPDIRLPLDPFPVLLSRLEDPAIAAVAPLIRNPAGELEDHARPFPTLPLLFRKLVERQNPRRPVSEPFQPDWIAGMFMLFRRDAFAAVGGFDEGYFMYYEDVDLCARLRAAGMRVEVNPAASAVHDARRASRRNLRHMLWHASSVTRFLGKRLLRKA
jgi:N-acetylglucosaminyl-diphospho-decaprenol L-rhamnosyltransferase